MKKNRPDYVPEADWDLLMRAEAECSGADVHPVRRITNLLSGYWLLEKGHSQRAKVCREILQAYLEGVPIRTAIAEHPRRRLV